MERSMGKTEGLGENATLAVTLVLFGLSHSTEYLRAGTRSGYILCPHCCALGLVQHRHQTMFVE